MTWLPIPFVTCEMIAKTKILLSALLVFGVMHGLECSTVVMAQDAGGQAVDSQPDPPADSDPDQPVASSEQDAVAPVNPSAGEPAAEVDAEIDTDTDTDTATVKQAVSDPDTDANAGTAAPGGPPKLEFSFEAAEWKTVLDWLAAESDLTLVIDVLPPGKFNFVDRRAYTPNEAIDVINSWLIARGFLLVQKNQLLVLLSLANEVPENFIRDVTVEDLDDLGSYDFARCTFVPKTLTTEQVKEEFSALIGSYGKMIVLPNTGRLVVTDLAPQLRTMRTVLGDLETSSARGGAQAAILPLEYITPDAAMLTIRQMYRIPEGEFATEDEALRFSIDPTGSKLLLHATADKLASVRELLRLIDIPLEGVDGAPEELADPEFKSYAIEYAEPTIVLRVMQTLLAGQPEVRLDVSEESKMLYALARPDDQLRIQTTLEKMQGQGDQIEVFPLEILDADLAKSRIESLLGTEVTDEKGVVSIVGPRMIADAVRRQLIVRGNAKQMASIRRFLEKMGESPDGEGSTSTDQTLRVVPMDGVVTKAVLERALEIWPTVRANPVRIVLPDTPDDAVRTLIDDPPPRQDARPTTEPNDAPPATGQRSGANPSTSSQPRRKTVRNVLMTRVTFLAQVDPEQALTTTEEPASANPTDPKDPTGPNDRKPDAASTRGPAASGDAPANSTADSAGKEADGKEADGKDPAGEKLPSILVTPGSGGLVIASDDLSALDEFEELVRLLSDPFLFPASDMVVFPLKHARAAEAKALLDELLGSGSAGGGASDPLAAMLGGGDMGLGALLGDSSTIGTVKITTDVRLNTLFVQAEPLDVDRVAQLIKVIDVAESPIKVETRPAPRVIALKRANATELAQTLQQAFPPDNAAGGGGGGGNNALQQLMQQIGGNRGERGGGGGGGGNDAGGNGGAPEIAIAADQRSNSLVVVAPDQIYEEIEKLALYLDDTATESTEVTLVVPVTRADPQAIQSALNSVFGSQVVAAAAGDNRSGSGGEGNGGGSSGRGDNNGQMNPEAIRAIQQRIQAFREAAGRGGGGGGRGGGGGGRGGGGGGRGGRGG